MLKLGPQFMDQVVKSFAGCFVFPVQDIPELRLVDTTDIEYFPDKTLILCESEGIYRFDRESNKKEKGNSVIAPTTGPGRWIKIK